jgi:hypothetical protein
VKIQKEYENYYVFPLCKKYLLFEIIGFFLARFIYPKEKNEEDL